MRGLRSSRDAGENNQQRLSLYIRHDTLQGKRKGQYWSRVVGASADVRELLHRMTQICGRKPPTQTQAEAAEGTKQSSLRLSHAHMPCHGSAQALPGKRSRQEAGKAQQRGAYLIMLLPS